MNKKQFDLLLDLAIESTNCELDGIADQYAERIKKIYKLKQPPESNFLKEPTWKQEKMFADWENGIAKIKQDVSKLLTSLKNLPEDFTNGLEEAIHAEENC